MPLSTFHIYTPAEFTTWIRSTAFTRNITFIQNHHTFLPSYQNFNAHPNHLFWLESMRNVHINERHWADIGQNITIFPDGMIAVCRPVDKTPAGIFGANTGAICIENMGDFDIGKDAMLAVQKGSIILTNALLCIKFDLRPNVAQVVYHHWFDRAGKRFTAQQINSGTVLQQQLQKTCPGTAFFNGNTGNDFVKGNTIVSAENNFYPLITEKINALNGAPQPPVNTLHRKVNTESLNVRNGRGTQFDIVKKLLRNTIVEVFAEQDNWSRISTDREEWVSSKFLSA